MTMTPTSPTVALDPNRNVPGIRRPGFADTLRAEWIKFWTVRSTQWSIVALFVLFPGPWPGAVALGIYLARIHI